MSERAADPLSHDVSPAERAAAAAAALGADRFGAWCAEVLVGAVGMADLIDNADPDPRWLADGAWTSWGTPATWNERGLDYWPRVWAARSLLHVWYPAAEPAVATGLNDDHWRVREMCAKIVAAHEVGGCADRCATMIISDDNDRVRLAALRAIGTVGEAEHVPAVRRAGSGPDPQIGAAADSTLRALSDRLDRSID